LGRHSDKLTTKLADAEDTILKQTSTIADLNRRVRCCAPTHSVFSPLLM